MKNTNPGFTTLELIIVIAIAGILAASITFSIRRYLIEMRYERYIIDFYCELKSLRAQSIKSNERYLLKMTKRVQNQGQNPYYTWDYKIYSDVNRNFNRMHEASEEVKISSFLVKNNQNGSLEFGFPSPMPHYAPTSFYRMDWYFRGDWNVFDHNYSGVVKRVWYTIVYEPDEIGTINNGIIYLKNSRVPQIGYAIFKLPNSNQIKLYKWNGHKWYEI